MPKLKFDVTDSDAEEAKEGSFGGFPDPPQPGLHRYRIKEVNAGHAKGEGGKPDTTKPRIEVVLECQTAGHKGSHMWAYFLQKPHPQYAKRDAEKWDQLLQALGISSATKRSGTIDTDKQMVDKFIVVNVKRGKDNSGDYRAEYGAAFPDGHDGLSSDGDEELLDESGEGELADDGEMLDDGEGTDWDARREELMSAGVPDLKVIAKEYGITVSGKKKAELVDEFIAHEQSLEGGDEGDGELLDDDEELLDDDDTPSPNEMLTKEQLAALDAEGIKKVAGDFDIDWKGKRKSEIIDAILAAQGGEEMPF